MKIFLIIILALSLIFNNSLFTMQRQAFPPIAKRQRVILLVTLLTCISLVENLKRDKFTVSLEISLIVTILAVLLNSYQPDNYNSIDCQNLDLMQFFAYFCSLIYLGLAGYCLLNP